MTSTVDWNRGTQVAEYYYLQLCAQVLVIYLVALHSACGRTPVQPMVQYIKGQANTLVE